MKNRILIVEDDRAISDAVALHMQFVGYAYAVFDDGKKAADSLADDHAYDLALLDIMLPGIDGFELFSYMEKYNIPVIYMTAKTDSASEIKGLMDGAEDYIVKPFDMLTLMVRIEKVLRRTGRLNTVYRVRDIEVNSETRVVTKAGEEVELQPLEFDVLLTLLKNKNLTVSREQLLTVCHTFDTHHTTCGFCGGPRSGCLGTAGDNACPHTGTNACPYACCNTAIITDS